MAQTRTDPPSEAAQDALRRLEERLERASDAAERLFAQAAGEAAAAAWRLREDAPQGYQVPGAGAPPAGGEVDALLEAVGEAWTALRERVPPELGQRLIDALREVLLALRALIDWYLERLERRRAEPVEVQDIPVT